MKIGIIGFGRLGRLMARYIGQDADVVVADTDEIGKEARAYGVKSAGIEEVCACPVVIPSVPIGQFESVIQQMSPHLKAGTLVADVCSVKEHPVEVMQKYLSEDVHILATHPMFGPDSARETLFGRKIVLCNIRTPENLYQNIKAYLESNGLKVIESTAEQHDRDIARSLVLTHFVGRGLLDYGAQPLEIDTKGYRRLLKILDQVENDSLELFKDMNQYNRFAKTAREEFLASLKDVNHWFDED